MNVWLWNQRDRRFEEPTADISSWTLVAADSWFVEDSRMRAFDHHQARFARAAAEVGVGKAVTTDFWAAVLEKLPATGEWFPRVDVVEAPSGSERELAFRLRPAPERTRELRVLVPPFSDPRATPDCKGPDIALLEGVRADAREQYGCDEVLLLSADGHVIEGATTSLLWWDVDTLCAPDPELGALSGTTSAVILEEARARSIPVEFRRVRPEELFGHEVWLVNALHGIRQVKEFVDKRDVHDRVVLGEEAPLVQTAPDDGNGEKAERLRLWREWLEAVSVPPGM
ncbi:aminotransferase class IV [Brevibacterium aurantiacum]|uniref:Aminotransferase class IV n=1 Tax=Brevibacterium aurantiacum TaxID=273384 RepID=A0A4Z0KKB9_BREAU|nr:aminotransferase class IV [Brevibacterium aurantiacum]TGD37839.1 aminotransferase class IV [Brevibacterium aurantiacum]